MTGPCSSAPSERLRQAGIQDVQVTTHYLGDRIANHFGDGKAFGVDITYLNEDRPSAPPARWPW